MDFKEFKKKYEKKEVREFLPRSRPKPLVSVLVLAYQHVNFIEQCLDSILMQETDFDYEILLGEDDSSDGTREICIKYARKYPKIIKLFLHHRENNIKIQGRPTGKFNFVFSYYSVQGDYIAICEGDDYWVDPLKLQKQIDFLKKNNEIVIHGGNAVYNSPILEINGQKLYDSSKDEKFEVEDFLTANNLATCTVLFRKINLELPRLFLKINYGDWYLYLILLKQSGLAAYRSKQVFSVYRQHDGSFMNQQDILDDYKTHIRHIKWNYELLNVKLNYTGIKTINSYYLKIFRRYHKHKMYLKAFQTFLQNIDSIGFKIPLRTYINELKI